MNGFFRRPALVTALATALIVVGEAQSAPIAYPAKGQSQQQQQKDDGECYGWAKSTTGIDPAAVAAAPPTQPAQVSSVGGGERIAGAARGAVIGGIVGGSDEAWKGAGVGAVVGGARARQNQKTAQAEANAQAQSKTQATIDTFYRAHSACMEGRGYTIK